MIPRTMNNVVQGSTRQNNLGKVSILIPTKGDIPEDGSSSLWIKCLDSIFKRTNYSNYEVVLVADNEIPENFLESNFPLSEGKLRVVHWDQAFNFSQKMNFGFTFCSGENILLLNDDIEVVDSGWLDEMLLLLKRTQAGIVGATLLFPNGSIQHAGQTIYRGGPTHIARGLSLDDPLIEDFINEDREVLGVTAACALMSAQMYLNSGGFSSLFPGNYNDVDLCMKIRFLGFPIYISAKAILVHHESVTRNAHVHFHELDLLQSRWGINTFVDPFWTGHPYKLTKKSGKYRSLNSQPTSLKTTALTTH